jgi:hypothetical protein
MKDRPPVAVVVREGDPSAALAVAVLTGGIAPERGAEVAVALAALAESRLAGTSKASDLGVVPAWDGYRIRALVGAQPASATALVDAVQRALATPVAANELPAIKKKLDALAMRRIADASLVDVTRCRGEAFGLPRPPAPATLAELEAWRRAAHGLGRVAIAAVGSSQTTDAVAAAVARGAAWSPGAPFAPSEPAPATEAPSVYDASGELSAGEARAVLAFQVPRAEQAVAVAPALADPRGPLVSRLRALEATKEAPKVRELVATAHARGGCLSVTLDFRDLGSDPAARIATAVALTRQEVSAELGDAIVSDETKSLDAALTLARRAGDPREAAERAAWWTLVRPGADPVVRVAVAVGITNGRDAPPRNTTDSLAAPSSAAAALAPLRQEIERAVLATSAPVVEGKTKVEKGQSDLWVLFGSPCGTLPEVDLDAGLGAAFAFTAVEEARARSGSRIEIEPFVASDGIGVLAHASALPGEPPTALARRVADAAARSFAADPIDPALASRARTALLTQASESIDGRSLVALAGAVAPGHPSWFVPTGTFDALGRSSDATLFTRSAALRAGALRVGVIANTDAAQATAAVRAVDRWVTRRAGESRTCATPSTPPPPRPGTYPVDATGNPSEAWIAIPLVSPTSAPDEAGRALASWTAALLDGPDGLLARALGPAALAREWSAKVIGPARAAALVIRITSGQAALDAAVAQTRALLARLQKGAIDEGDRARAIALRQRNDLQRALDPRARLVALWRGEPESAPAPPSLEALRAFAGATLRDDALVIVAARSPRATPVPSSTPSAASSSSAKSP